MSADLARPSPLRCVLFDLDGVLVDSERAWFETLRLSAMRFDAGEMTFERWNGTFGQGITADQRMFFPHQTVDEVRAAYDEFYPLAVDAAELLPGARALLESLSQADMRTAIVTNAPRGAAAAVVEAHGLAGLLDTILTSSDGPEKPSPMLLSIALDRLGCAFTEAVFIGDSATDRAAAKAAGIYFIGRGIDGDARVEALTELELELS